MKRVLLLIGFVCISIVGIAQNRADELRGRLLNSDRTGVMVVAHRGDWRYAPENSILAIQHSIAVGVDVVELDLQLTKDSVLIIMHDATLNRTTTGKGAVADWTLDSIRTLRLKSGCGIKTKQSVPTLEEALLVAKGRVLINLDKADRYFDLLYPVLEKTGTANQIIMKGSKPAVEVIALYGKYLDKVIYMPIVNLDKDDANTTMNDYASLLKPVAYELIYAEDGTRTPLDMKNFLADKSLIWYNTLWDTLCGGHDDDKALENCDAAYGYLIDTLGASIIQTDRAELLLSYLQKRGLHD